MRREEGQDVDLTVTKNKKRRKKTDVKEVIEHKEVRKEGFNRTQKEKQTGGI